MSVIVRLREIRELPTLPEVVLRIQRLIHSETSDASMLARIIEKDPPLASKVLRVANSSFYGNVHSRITSVSRAVARLGFNEVRDLSLAMSLIKQFGHRRSVLGYQLFWEHSLTAAYLSRIIADSSSVTFDDNERQTLFMAGLLHDIGILTLDQFFPEEFARIRSRALQEEQSYLQAEHAIVEKEPHPTVGGALLEFWKMANAVIAAVRDHHTPEKSPEKYRKFASVIAVAEYILCNSGIGSFEGSFLLTDEEIWERLGVSEKQTAELYTRAHEEAKLSNMAVEANADGFGARLPTI